MVAPFEPKARNCLKFHLVQEFEQQKGQGEPHACMTLTRRHPGPNLWGPKEKSASSFLNPRSVLEWQTTHGAVARKSCGGFFKSLRI